MQLHVINMQFINIFFLSDLIEIETQSTITTAASSTAESIIDDIVERVERDNIKNIEGNDDCQATQTDTIAHVSTTQKGIRYVYIFHSIRENFDFLLISMFF